MITDDFDEEQSAHIAARIDLVVHVEEDPVLVLLRGLNARHGLTRKPVRSLRVLDLQRSQSWPTQQPLPLCVPRANFRTGIACGNDFLSPPGQDERRLLLR